MIKLFSDGVPVGEIRLFIWKEGSKYLLCLDTLSFAKDAALPIYRPTFEFYRVAGGLLVRLVEKYEFVLLRGWPFVYVNQ
jgi:hypothetical protein